MCKCSNNMKKITYSLLLLLSTGSFQLTYGQANKLTGKQLEETRKRINQGTIEPEQLLVVYSFDLNNSSLPESALSSLKSQLPQEATVKTYDQYVLIFLPSNQEYAYDKVIKEWIYRNAISYESKEKCYVLNESSTTH